MMPYAKQGTNDELDRLLSNATLIFNEDFNDWSGIDIDNTQADGYNFYIKKPFGWGVTPKNRLSINDSVLTINNYSSVDDPVTGTQWAICSAMPISSGVYKGFAPTGKLFFEASIAFNPADFNGATAQNAFWTMAAEHVFGGTPEPYNYLEMDFMEYNLAWHGTLDYFAAMHTWVKNGGSNVRTTQGDEEVRVGLVNYNQFNRYGVLWVPGSRIEVYFNKMLERTQTFSTFPNLAVGNTQKFPIILGSPMPMHVDWVRCWSVP